MLPGGYLLKVSCCPQSPSSHSWRRCRGRSAGVQRARSALCWLQLQGPAPTRLLLRAAPGGGGGSHHPLGPAAAPADLPFHSGHPEHLSLLLHAPTHFTTHPLVHLSPHACERPRLLLPIGLWQKWGASAPRLQQANLGARLHIAK